MLYKRYSSEIGQDDDVGIDEGWWASVLSDDTVEHQEKLITPEYNSAIRGDVDWGYVRSLYENDEITTLEVYGCNRGGLLVQGAGIQGFVPVSHLVEINAPIPESERQEKLAGYIGRSLKLKVIECEPAQDRIVLSERAALAGEGRRKQLFRTLKPGDKVDGIVTNIIDFGVFVDLGGLEGLIHVSELSWGRVQHPSDFVKIGHCVTAVVLSVSELNGRVALSIKRLLSNPWETITKCYQPGDIVPAEITSVLKFGAFARLQEGVEGLIHISTIDVPAGSSICDVLEVGMSVQVRILHIDSARRRLGLGLVKIE